MKNKILTTAILLTGLLSASTYHYTFKISDTSLFKESQQSSYDTPEERTGVPSTGVILASDGGVDWYGEVSPEDFIDGIELSNRLNFLMGNNINSNTKWLHVGLDGKELLIPKKPIRNNISWNYLNSLNLITGNSQVNINGQDYIIRLLIGSSNSAPTLGAHDHVATHNSEWNRIFYRLSNNIYSNTNTKKDSEEPFINLANYTEEDLSLGIINDNIPGYLNITQGTTTQGFVSGTYAFHRVLRGGVGVSYYQPKVSHDHNNAIGWRPVLEKIN